MKCLLKDIGARKLMVKRKHLVGLVLILKVMYHDMPCVKREEAKNLLGSMIF